MYIKEIGTHLEPQMTHRFIVNFLDIPSYCFYKISNIEYYTNYNNELVCKPITFYLYSFVNPNAESFIHKSIINQKLTTIPEISVGDLGPAGDTINIKTLFNSKILNIDFGVNDYSIAEPKKIKIVVEPKRIK